MVQYGNFLMGSVHYSFELLLNYLAQHKHLRSKRTDDLYSIRVNKQYRILYFKYESYIESYRLLDHDKYDRLSKDC